MNRKLLSFIAAFLLILMLASCAQSNESIPTNGDPVPAEVDNDQNADTDDGQDADTEDPDGEETEAETETPAIDPVPAEVDDDQNADTDDGQVADPEDSDGEETEAETPAIDPGALFLSNCVLCHNSDRSGDKGPSLLPDRLTGEASEYADTITNGRGEMPTWRGKLSADEIKALSEWILTTPE